MADIEITVDGGDKKRLLTAGKCCDRDILVTARGSSNIDEILNGEVTEVSSNVTYLRNYALQNCHNLKYANLPFVSSMGSYTFQNCESLKEVNIPMVKALTTYCFRECAALEKIDLHVVSSIANRAFRRCVLLETVIIRTGSVCPISEVAVFQETPIESGTGFVYVPKNLVEEYKVATNWTVYANQFRAIEDYPEITGG